MRHAESTRSVDYPNLTRWFFASGARRYRKSLALLLLMTVMVAFSEGISLWLIVPILGAVIPTQNEVNSGPVFVDSLTNVLTSLAGPDALLPAMLTLMLLLVAAKTALTLTTNWQTARCQWGLMSDWARQLLSTYLQQDYLSFLANKHGAMLGSITIETRIAAIGVRDAIHFLSQLVLSLAYVVVLLATNWQITLFQLAAILVLSVATWGFTHRMTSRISRDVLESKQHVEIQASESLSAFRQIKASALESDAVKSFATPVDQMAKLMTKQNTYNAVPKPASELLVLLLVIGTVYYFYAFTGLVVASQLPSLILLVIIANRLFMSLARLATSYMAFTASLPSMQLIATRLGKHSELPQMPAGDCKVKLNNDIVFRNVGFRYPGVAERALDDLNLKIGGGQLTALVGASGGGKSTIIDLLLGFIEPDEGTLYLDGRDSRDIDMTRLRNKIGYVSQDVFLFDCSIRDNLLTYKPDASDADIAAVCEQARIAELVAKLPDGLDTPVGPRGARLSGGERQRLAIAIALLRDPELLIFDEATNALDPEAEYLVQMSVRGLQDKTVLFVSHRITAALQPDRMYELKNGKVSELGNANALEGDISVFTS